MSKPPDRDSEDAHLNPALHAKKDKSHGTQFEGTDPMKTVSVQDPKEGRNWPLVWAVVGIVCVLALIYIVI
jgi:hypothetical protein